jgi:hypothetical protein
LCTYLTTNTLNRLKVEMLKELSLGTTIISLDYSVEWLEPFQVIEALYGSECCRIYIL